MDLREANSDDRRRRKNEPKEHISKIIDLSSRMSMLECPFLEIIHHSIITNYWCNYYFGEKKDCCINSFNMRIEETCPLPKIFMIDENFEEKSNYFGE